MSDDANDAENDARRREWEAMNRDDMPSLRRQLTDEAKLAEASWWNHQDDEDYLATYVHEDIVDAVWPLVSEAVAAAEVRVAEQIAEIWDRFEREKPEKLTEFGRGYYDGVKDFRAAVARSVPGLLEGQTE